MSSCCRNIITEIACPPPPPPTNGSYDASYGIWFRCFYSSCHAGIGHVLIKDATNRTLYDGYPSTGSRDKYAKINFDLNALNTHGGTMTVNYYRGGSHTCNSAVFEWGYARDEQLVIGTANLDNAGGSDSGGSRYNTFTIPTGMTPPAPPPIPPPSVVVSGAKRRELCIYGSGVYCNSTPTPPGFWLTRVIPSTLSGFSVSTTPAGTVDIQWGDSSNSVVSSGAIVTKIYT
jgi:hypothetical protein